MQELNPLKIGDCYGACACKCNKVCLENCEEDENPLTCRLGCGCTPTEEDIIKRDEPKVQEKVAEVKTIKNKDCNESCTKSCLKTAIGKSETIECFVDCGCFPVTSNIELAEVPEIVLNGQPSSSPWGYLLFSLFLIAIIVGTIYLIIDREGKKSNTRDEEYNSNLIYNRLD